MDTEPKSRGQALERLDAWLYPVGFDIGDIGMFERAQFFEAALGQPRLQTVKADTGPQ